METFTPSRWQGVRSFTRRYEISDRELVVRWGLASRHTSRISRDKITNVDVALGYLFPGSSVVRVNVGSGEPVACRGLTRKTARMVAAALQNDESRPAQPEG